MPPKRKALNCLQDEKIVKKGSQSKMEDSMSWKNKVDATGEKHAGKNVKCDDKEKERDFGGIEMETVLPELLNEKQNINKAECPPILELNQLIQKKSKIIFQGSISWKVFLFPSLPKLALIPNKLKQYFGLDLVEDGSERTIWTHKASVWQQLFKSVQDLEKTGHVLHISNKFKGILACPVRAVSNGPNEIESFKSVKE